MKTLRQMLDRLSSVEAPPNSVALGLALGIFLGFTPLFGLKTMLALLMAWVFRFCARAALTHAEKVITTAITDKDVFI